MRRGSKCPSMLNLAKLNLELLECEEAQSVLKVEQPRRLSLMSALKLSLEHTGLEPKGERKDKKMYSKLSTYELLSQI